MGVTERTAPGHGEWSSLQADHLARYVFASEYAKGKRVLDAGTGFGYGAAMLRIAGASHVVGVDISSEVINDAKTRYGAPSLEFVVDDCELLANVRGPFDLICSFENIEHLRNPDRFLSNAARLLADGGVLLISTHDRMATELIVRGRPAKQFHTNEWYSDEFLALLRGHFDQVDLRIQVRAHWVTERSRAVESLRSHLKWSNPFVWYANRLVYAMTGRWPLGQFFGLMAPALGDYPIVEESLSGMMGDAVVFVALCRKVPS